MCEASTHNKHFQTTVILKCQLININEEARLHTGAARALLLSINTNMQHLGWITMTLMSFGSSRRIWYKNGSDFGGKQSLEFNKWPQNFWAYQKVEQLWLADREVSLRALLMVTQSCQRWLWGWNTAASFTVGDGEDLLDGHELACVRSWGGKRDPNHSCRATSHTRPTSLHFLARSYTRFLPERDIMQLIMTRKIIAARMMKTLDLWPWGGVYIRPQLCKEGESAAESVPSRLVVWPQESVKGGWFLQPWFRMRERSCGHDSICPIWGRYEAPGTRRPSRSCGCVTRLGPGLWTGPSSDELQLRGQEVTLIPEHNDVVRKCIKGSSGAESRQGENYRPHTLIWPESDHSGEHSHCLITTFAYNTFFF